MSYTKRDEEYRSILLAPIWESTQSKPKMGTKTPITLESFLDLYGSDPFYHWIGLDNPLVYQAAKGNSGMTSIYRQIGTGAERLFRKIIMDEFNLTKDQANWSYQILATNQSKGKTRKFDARIDISMINDPTKKLRVENWLEGIQQIFNTQFPFRGAVFEVRQGYKSQDSKRSQGDTDNGAYALYQRYQMIMAVISNQISTAARMHYQSNAILVLTGTMETDSPYESTYAFMDQIVGYDFAGFFERNSQYLRESMQTILEKTLTLTGKES